MTCAAAAFDLRPEFLRPKTKAFDARAIDVIRFAFAVLGPYNLDL